MNEVTPNVAKNDNVPIVPVRPTPATLAAKRPDAIPVRLLMLATPRNVPGEDSAGRVRCDPAAANNQRRWTITFIPGFRHFEITYYPNDASKPAEVGYIHETHASAWWPVAQS